MAGRIGVLGAGGMGTAFAAHLARTGADVVLVGRGSEHVRALASEPLVVEPPDAAPWSVRVPVAVTAADLAPGSLGVLLILTKAFDLAEAARAAEHALAADGVAVPLQNGLGTAAATAAVFGGGRSLIGTTTVGAALRAPGRISISVSTATGTSLTYLGESGPARAGHDLAVEVADALSRAGLPGEASREVDELIWGKLALAAMSPVSASLRVTVAAVWRSAEGRALVERMFDEVVEVAAAEGVTLDRDAAWAHARRTFEGTGEHYTSMCTDVMHDRRTELGSMAGAVRALGERHAVPVPAHATVVDLLGVLGVR